MKHMQLICNLRLASISPISISLPILLKCTLNTSAFAVTIQRRGLSVPGQECTDTICIGSTVHTNEWCKVYNCMLLCNMKYINSYHSARALQSQSKTKKQTAGKGHHPVLTPDWFIAHLTFFSIFSRQPYPPSVSQNNVTVLYELKLVVCSDILTQTLEVPCRMLACIPGVLWRG